MYGKVWHFMLPFLVEWMWENRVFISVLFSRSWFSVYFWKYGSETFCNFARNWKELFLQKKELFLPTEQPSFDFVLSLRVFLSLLVSILESPFTLCYFGFKLDFFSNLFWDTTNFWNRVLRLIVILLNF